MAVRKVSNEKWFAKCSQGEKMFCFNTILSFSDVPWYYVTPNTSKAAPSMLKPSAAILPNVTIMIMTKYRPKKTMTKLFETHHFS